MPTHFRILSIALFVAVFVALGGCGSSSSNNGTVTATAASPSPSPNPSPGPIVTPVQQGHWGGTGIKLDVTANGGSYELDCAHGTIDQPLVADENGSFHATGTITSEGGPVGPTPRPAHPAQFDGVLHSSSQMSLTITTMTDASHPTSATYQLQFGNAGTLVKCL
jgi:hypothetical protein